MKYLLVSMITMGLIMSVFAQEAAKVEPPRIRGIVKEVKLEAEKTDVGTLTITPKNKVDGDSMAFVVNADLPIKSGNALLKLSDLKVGDKVRVDYNEAEGKKTAVKVRVENENK